MQQLHGNVEDLEKRFNARIGRILSAVENW
jgi:hypothetical protein